MITLALFSDKAPEAAAFGSFLMAKKCGYMTRFTYITAYSISSPLTAFGTYMFLAKQKSLA